MSVIVVLLASCNAAQLNFQRTSQVPDVELPAAGPPPVAEPTTEKLYQYLYVSEVGDDARPAGQRARMLAWLTLMKLASAQLTTLYNVGEGLERMRADDARMVREVGVREQAELGPVYRDIIRVYAAPDARPAEGDLGALAERLYTARKAANGEDDPRKAQLKRVRTMLNYVKPFVAQLTPEQRATLGQSRFFLSNRVAPFLNPDAYMDLVGIEWDGGDFSSLRDTVRDPDEEHMDLGGLWSTDAIRSAPGNYLDENRLYAVTVMALTTAGTLEAIEVKLGTRQPDDFAPRAVAP